MMLVDLDRGRTDAYALAKTLEDLSRERDARDDLLRQQNSNEGPVSRDVRRDLEGEFSYQRE